MQRPLKGRHCIRTPVPRTRFGVPRDQVVDRDRVFHGAGAPRLDAGL